MKPFVSCESDQTVAKVAQKDGGVSILANMQKLSGHDLGEHDLSVSSWAWVLDWMTSRGLWKSQPSCDSVPFIYSYFCLSQSRATLINFCVISVYRISAISTLRAILILDSPSLCGVWSVPDFPSLFWYYLPPKSVRQNLQKVFHQKLVTATTSWHSSSLELFTTFVHHCSFLSVYSFLFFSFLPPFPAVNTHQFPCKMPLPSLFLLRSLKNNRKTQNFIKSMYLFLYSKWNANTEVIFRGNLSSNALVTVLGQGGHKQTRVFTVVWVSQAKVWTWMLEVKP